MTSVTENITWIEKRIQLRAISNDTALQLRTDGVNARVASDYAARMKAGDCFPPIILARVEGGYYVVDGFHRVAAARLAGLDSLPARIARTTADEAARLAFRANLKHGKRLTNADKRNRVAQYVSRGLHQRPDGAVKSPYVVSDELGGVPTARSIYNYYKKLGIRAEEHDEERLPWRPSDVASQEELLEDLAQQLGNVRGLCEQLEGIEGLASAVRQLRGTLEWLNAELGQRRYTDLAV